MGDITHYQLYPTEAALSAALAKSDPLDLSFSCSPIIFFAIESVNFTDFVQRAAIAII